MQQHQPTPLNLSDIAVTSFETSPSLSLSSQYPITSPTDQTYCFVCDPFTSNC